MSGSPAAEKEVIDSGKLYIEIAKKSIVYFEKTDTVCLEKPAERNEISLFQTAFEIYQMNGRTADPAPKSISENR